MASPGRLTRATLHCQAGEADLRLSEAGNWQLSLRAEGEPEWRLACSGDLQAGAATVPPIADQGRAATARSWSTSTTAAPSSAGPRSA